MYRETEPRDSVSKQPRAEQRIEVQLKPAMSGFLMLVIGCLSLGLAPLLMRWGERRFVGSMDEFGVETRSGKRIAWAAFTSIKRVRSSIGAGPRGAVVRQTSSDDLSSPIRGVSDEYLLQSRHGRVSVPVWRAKNVEEVRAYVLAHVPHLLPSRPNTGRGPTVFG